MSAKTVDVFVAAAILLAAIAALAPLAGLPPQAFGLASCMFLVGSAIVDRLDKIIAALEQKSAKQSLSFSESLLPKEWRK